MLELTREREYQRGSIRGVTMHGLVQRYGQLVRETRDLYEAGHDRSEVYEILTRLQQALIKSLDRHHHAYFAELQRQTGQDRLVRMLERVMEAKE